MDLATWVSRHGRWVIPAVAGLLVAVVVVASVVTVVVARAAPAAMATERDTAAEADQAQRCARASTMAAERRALDTGRGAEVVVIGDSYAVGGGEPKRSWPVRLPGRVHVDAFAGTGFSERASPCGPVSYADRAARAVAGHPGALVVVEGGLNDHAQPDGALMLGFLRLVHALAGHRLVVVGPPPAPERAAAVPRVDALLRRLAAGSGATYVSMVDADLDYLRSGLHPTRRGHRDFGDRVAVVVQPLLRPGT